MKYKLRAECSRDIQRFFEMVNPKQVGKFKMIGSSKFPDVELIFKSKLKLNELISILSKIEDCHVMVETINLKSNYTGERDYNLENFKEKEVIKKIGYNQTYKFLEDLFLEKNNFNVFLKLKKLQDDHYLSTNIPFSTIRFKQVVAIFCEHKNVKFETSIVRFESGTFSAIKFLAVTS